MNLLAIDPGPEQSAFVLYDTETQRLARFGKWPNGEVRFLLDDVVIDELAIEMIASYGMPVGAEVFRTCLEIGRLIECWQRLQPANPPLLIPRSDVKMCLCRSPRANDATIRQALIDLYGPGKEQAIGRKKSPGPLYGVTGDVWAALGVAVTAAETLLNKGLAT